MDMDDILAAIRQKLQESAVIETVLEDFYPRMHLSVFYGEKQISLGEELSLAEVQSPPVKITVFYNREEIDLSETFSNPRLVGVVSSILSFVRITTCFLYLVILKFLLLTFS